MTYWIVATVVWCVAAICVASLTLVAKLADRRDKEQQRRARGL